MLGNSSCAWVINIAIKQTRSKDGTSVRLPHFLRLSSAIKWGNDTYLTWMLGGFRETCAKCLAYAGCSEISTNILFLNFFHLSLSFPLILRQFKPSGAEWNTPGKKSHMIPDQNCSSIPVEIKFGLKIFQAFQVAQTIFLRCTLQWTQIPRVFQEWTWLLEALKILIGEITLKGQEQWRLTYPPEATLAHTWNSLKASKLGRISKRK